MPTQSVVGRRPLRKQLKHIFGYIYTCFFFLSLRKAIRYSSLRKQPTFSDATTAFILLQPIRSTTQIWVVTRHRYGIFVSTILRSDFAVKIVLASQNVGCFLKLHYSR